MYYIQYDLHAYIQNSVHWRKQLRWTDKLTLQYRNPPLKISPTYNHISSALLGGTVLFFEIQWRLVTCHIQRPFFNLSILGNDSVDPNDQKKTACYDIDVEVEDPLKSQMSSFLLSTANQQEIASLDNKVSQSQLQTVHDTANQSDWNPLEKKQWAGNSLFLSTLC